jgi:hypothetical protein
LFGRRKRDDLARAEVVREAERRALFEQLAKRPETVCPFLGLAGDRAGFKAEPNGEHRCYAFGDPAPLSDEQQRHVCLERGYSNCPRYLRGVLVIPTEELEALRRPQPHVVVAPPPPPPVKAEGGGSRRRLLILPLVLVLVAAVGAGSWYFLNKNSSITILPTLSASPSASQSGTPAPSATSSFATATAAESLGPTPTPLPTPTAGDVFVGYEVGVGPTDYQLFMIDSNGAITHTKSLRFSRFSQAPVQGITAPNGLHYWETTQGGLTGWSYIAGRSGPFEIRKVYRAPDGSRRATVLPSDQI